MDMEMEDMAVATTEVMEEAMAAVMEEVMVTEVTEDTIKLVEDMVATGK